MIVIFIIAIIFYLLAWHIQSRSYTYTRNQWTYDRWHDKKINDGEIANTKVTYTLFRWLVSIFFFFIPILNVVFGLILIISLLKGILNSQSYVVYRKDKFVTKVVSILSKEF